MTAAWGIGLQKPLVCVSQLGAAALLLWALSSSALAEDAPLEINGAKTVDYSGVVDLITKTPGVAIIDNRTAADFDSGHIEGAVRILDTDMTQELLAGAVSSRSCRWYFIAMG